MVLALEVIKQIKQTIKQPITQAFQAYQTPGMQDSHSHEKRLEASEKPTLGQNEAPNEISIVGGPERATGKFSQ